MLSLEALETFLIMNEQELLQDFIIGLMAAPQLAVFFEKFPRLKQALLKEHPQWRLRLQQRLKDTAVPEALAREFTLFQHQQRLTNTDFFQQLPETLSVIKQQESPFYPEAEALCPPDNTPRSDSFQTLFIQRWRISLIARTLTLHHQVMEQERQQLQAELEQRLQLSGALEPVLVENENAAGRLWDLSHSGLHQGDSKLLVQYGEFLSHQPELQKLAQQLGRSRIASAETRQSTHQETHHIMIREPAAVPEEVSGIRQSDDILRLLPTELVTLGISDLEFEFYRRLLEKRLLTYRLQGDVWREHQFQRPVVYNQDEQQPRGPFIVCVDTSGSMGGFNEQCAKAFCLALLRIALADNRRCYVTLFSSDIVSFELTADNGIEQAIRFLAQRFRGGTDLARCLAATAALMRQSAWRQADAVVISDFIAQRLPDDVIRQIGALQEQNGHRFHAVAVSEHGKPGIMRIFDHIWRFDTGIKGRLLRRWKR